MNEVKGIAQTFTTKYVILHFNPSDSRYAVNMATIKEFESPHDAQDYINVMNRNFSNYNFSNYMIVPVMREVLG